MDKGICPITNKIMNCKDCKLVKETEECPIWELEDGVTKITKKIREYLEDEFKTRESNTDKME